MTRASQDAWADLILRGAELGQLDLAPFAGRLSVEEGERVQLDVLERRRAAGEQLGGWKVGLTSGASRDAFGKGIRPFGHILRSRMLESGARIARAAIPNLGLENELCFRIGARLSGSGTTAADVRRAVAAVAPAFEINQNRTGGQADPGTRTADNLSQWGIVIGAETAPLPDGFDFEALTVALTLDGRPVETVAARGHIDDHYASLAALVAELAKFGRALEPGERVITGAYTRVPVRDAGLYRGTFTGLGSVDIEVV